jgi:MOSC domain-containing protein YiiM
VNVERIFISPERGAPQIECDQISVECGRGVIGDRNFGKNIHPGQNITLVEAEEIELFLSLHDRLPDLSLTRRNLVTRGVRLNELLGKEFMIGDVRLRGVELCEPCTILASCLETEAVPSAQIIKRWVGRGGLRADILSHGIIDRGARVGAAA